MSANSIPQHKPKSKYASLFTLRKDGRYQGSYTDSTGRHFLYDRDPERLWHRLNDPKPEATFAEAAELWYVEACDRLREGTMAGYDASYQRAVDRVGDLPLTEITANDIYNHLLLLKSQGYSASTIKKQRIVYHQIFQRAIVDRTIGQTIQINPANNVPLPSGLPKPHERQAPEEDVVRAIRERAETAYFGLFAMFLICTGFRRGEALAVQWGDIDYQAETISCTGSVSHRSGVAVVGPTKTEHGIRDVPLLPPLAAVLHRPAEARDADYVFHGDDPSKPMPQATYDRRWTHYCKDMGFTLTAHELRHGYATMLFEAGVDVYTAQKLLGHADITTTMAIYTHLRDAKQKESISALRDYANQAMMSN